MSRHVVAAAMISGCLGASAAASIGFGIDPNGLVYSVNTSNSGQTSFFVSTPLNSADGLARDPGTGYLWGINWNGSLTRIDPSTRIVTSMGLVSRPGQGGFYKDLAWDPINNRLLATHLGTGSMGGTANRIVQIDIATRQHTVLGEVTGMPTIGGPQVLGLGVNSAGEAAIFNFADGYIYDLGTVPVLPAGTIAATRRSVRSFALSQDMRGLEFDHVTGQLFSSGQGLYEIAPDGTATLVPGFSSPQLRDLTFIPAPGTLALLGGVCAGLCLRTRRSPRAGQASM